MAQVMVIDERGAVAEAIVNRLRESSIVTACQRAPNPEDGFGGEMSGGYAGLFIDQEVDTVVYCPPLAAGKRTIPDLEDAEAVFQECANAGIKRAVVLSSAAVYGASHHNPGLVRETRPSPRGGKDQIATRWADLEGLALIYLGGHPGIKLTILRPVALPVRGGSDYFSRLFGSRVAVTFPGYDPSLQVLSLDDLAEAVKCVIEKSEGGTYNVAPDGVAPLRAALRLSGSHRIPVPRGLQRAVRSLLGPLKLARPIDQLDYIRYSWTVSNNKMKQELGFTPARSTVEALTEFARSRGSRARRKQLRESDDFGMDKEYIAAYGRGLFRFLHDHYWRIEVDGLEGVPREGRVVLVGVHRGLMPWDGVMALHLFARKLGRYPRFLIHPTLIKFPFLFNFMTKLGGMVACQDNADYVLERDGVLGIFPEGIHGAFAFYKNAYNLGRFGRDEFVKMALRNNAPIVPFVTVGSAEIFPILKKIDWRWWKRYSEWPCLPITPTFPLLPVPLPSKWHTQFLAPMHIEKRHPPEDADDPVIVRMISNEVRAKMEKAISEILDKRKSIFYGSVFKEKLGGSVFKQEVS